MSEPPEREVNPSIIVPDRSFLIGAIHGMNAGRRLSTTDGVITPIITGSSRDEVRHVPYIGHYLQCSCLECGYFNAWDDPNQIPEESLECGNDTCNNIVILYGVPDSNFWRIGSIKL